MQKKKYFINLLSLTKHGIILGNLLPTIAGFCLGSKVLNQKFDFLLFLNTCVFSSMVVAAGCVLNNWFDSTLDSKMKRTSTRVLPQKEISRNHALIFGIILAFVSIVGMFYFVNKIACYVAIFGLFSYVVLYTMLSKRTTVYGVHIGSISGAIPPVIGYSAALGVIDINALYFFLIIVIWQMPHSFAIQIFRFEDYQNAKIPTLPQKKGLLWTKISIISYIILFFVTNIIFSIRIGAIHIITSALLCTYWLKIARKFPSSDAFIETQNVQMPNEKEKKWAKKVFFGSIISVVGICTSIIFSSLI